MVKIEGVAQKMAKADSSQLHRELATLRGDAQANVRATAAALKHVAGAPRAAAIGTEFNSILTRFEAALQKSVRGIEKAETSGSTQSSRE